MTNDLQKPRAVSAADARATTAEETAPASAATERYLRIDEVARRTKLTKRTLRYYEEQGLLAPAQRSEGNYRLYSEADIHILEHIIAMRDLLGLELKEIREMVAAELERERIKAEWKSDDDPARRLAALDAVEKVAHRELQLLEDKLEGLETMRQTVLERLERYQRTRAEIRARVGLAHEPSDQASQSNTPAC